MIPDKILKLVDHFDSNKAAFKSSKYNETQVRLEFINPFFEALGWDIYNRQSFAESYKEVIHEDTIIIDNVIKAPDYSFRIGGQRKFFLEAKKPAVHIKENINPAYQVRRYGWSASLPVSILTDFEELAVYDTTIRPIKNDKASVARIFYCDYLEYKNQWDWLQSVFSKDAILKGSFDKYVSQTKGKRGTTTVDKEFLKEIEKWRFDLAKNIALRNNLDVRSLNFSVQKTIDRILFLRICEDRGIEIYGQLQELIKQDNIYEALKRIFEIADQKYNSSLFHFYKEKGRPTTIDEITLNLTIDNKILKNIINNLYYPESPYVFTVISSDILGNVYEQFLGKVIRLKGKSAIVEDKPEVKKAGGVYFTPTYIVEYIVKNTVIEFLKKKTPKMIAGSLKGHTPFRILDPACGSGSFLIQAYQRLLDWHKDWYVKNNPKKWKTAIYQGKGGEWYLTTQEKKKILLNNIFGVDIDMQAIEVTKLNLLLKVLENESQETIDSQLRIFHERALPDLGNNIKCGNSLIGTDFFKDKNLSLFDKEEMIKINAFDWQKEFSEIFKKGGFDCVIGNPPYIQLSMLDNFNNDMKTYLKNKNSSSMGRFNTFGFFLKQGVELLINKGYFGFIIPNTILTQDYYKFLREFILDECKISSIVSFDDLPFVDAVVENIIITLKKEKLLSNREKNYIKICNVSKTLSISETKKMLQKVFNNTYENSFNIKIDESLINFKSKLENSSEILSDLVEINQAIALKHDRKKYLFKEKKHDNFKPILDGRNIKRYFVQWHKSYLKYELKAIHSCKREDIFISQEKLFFRRVGNRLIAAYDNEQFYALNTLVVINLKSNIDYNLKYILALFNSKLLNFYYQIHLKSTKKVFSEIQAKQVGHLPIKKINFSKIEEKSRHTKFISLVNEMLKTQKDYYKSKTEADKKIYSQKIDLLDNQIDQLVYKLYGLTAKEIKIVEENT